jgi:hypothetical protein
MICSRPPRKVTYFEPVAPRLARNTIIESTFEVGRRFRCTMRVDCGELDPGAVIQAVSGDGTPACPSSSTKGSLRTGVPAAMRSISSPRSPLARASRSPTHKPGIRALPYGRVCRRQRSAADSFPGRALRSAADVLRIATGPTVSADDKSRPSTPRSQRQSVPSSSRCSCCGC